MNKVELLAPAGNMECLQTALYFGADAVYVAGQDFGLRAFADNFSREDLSEATALAHDQGKKLYVTVNAVMRNDELAGLGEYLEFLDGAGVDGAILSDPAVIVSTREHGLRLPLHLSTQASTTNYLSAKFWTQHGVKRIVLSREVSLAEITQIKKELGGSAELEVFVHGAMCIAHSGRCLLSSFMTGRSGNRGECAQPCRWEYYLHERGYEGQYFRIDEDARGTYILNSRDLMMIEHLPKLIAAGVSSFKIEGRMKSAYYVASTVSAYRRALDAYYDQGDSYVFDTRLKDELEKSATRGFTTGFFFGNPGVDGQDTERTTPYRQYVFAAKVTHGSADGYVGVEQRNKFEVGDVLEVLSPHGVGDTFTVTDIINEDGETRQSAPHPQQLLRLACPLTLRPGDLLRRREREI